MLDILGAILRRLGVANVLSLTLLSIALGSLAIGLAGMTRSLDLILLLIVGAPAVFSGWLLAKLRAPGRQAGLIIAGLGLIAILIVIGQVGDYMLAALRALALYSWQTLGGSSSASETIAVAQAVSELALRLNVLFTRLYLWLASLAAGEPAFDPVAAALTWGALSWAAAAWAAWAVEKNHPLWGLTPALVIAAAAAAYSGAGTIFFLPFLAGLFLLIALARHRAREQNWDAVGVDYSVEIRPDVAISAIAVTALLVVAAAVAPSVSLQRFTQWVQDFARSQGSGTNPFPESLGLQPPPAGASAFEPLRSPGLPRRHLIGSGAELSKRAVMSNTVSHPALRYYWRSATYDRYFGRGWDTSATEIINYRANVRVTNTLLPGQQLVHVDVEPLEPLGGITYTAGTLVSLDSDFSIAWRSGVDIFSSSTPATTYRVESLLALPGENQLRAASARYPQAIRDRYLALPNSVPPRVFALARQITATERTPYDRARAIETFLRAFPYTLDLPAPPPVLDVADYFLFDLKKGYCDYYATAMVVLARAAGLPARLVTGYAAGAYEEEIGRYLVTEADAHSWVEVYFEGYGWVEFEPTGGRPPIERSAETIMLPTWESTRSPDGEQPEGPASPVGWPTLVGGLGVVVLAAFAWGLIDRLRLASLAPAQTIHVLYQRLLRSSQPLNLVIDAGDTPYEFAHALAARLAPLTQKRDWLKPALEEARWLVDSYVRMAYSPRPPNRAEQRQAIRVWRKLRQRLWRVRLLRLFTFRPLGSSRP